MRVYIYLLKCRQSLIVQTHYDAGKNHCDVTEFEQKFLSKGVQPVTPIDTSYSQFPGAQSLLKLLIMQISEGIIEGMEHARTGFLQLHCSPPDCSFSSH